MLWVGVVMLYQSPNQFEEREERAQAHTPQKHTRRKIFSPVLPVFASNYKPRPLATSFTFDSSFIFHDVSRLWCTLGLAIQVFRCNAFLAPLPFPHHHEIRGTTERYRSARTCKHHSRASARRLESRRAVRASASALAFFFERRKAPHAHTTACARALALLLRYIRSTFLSL
jgi:hypothetical protein